MKKCIWCNKMEPLVTFATKAHTIPRGLGGVTFCDNVCDNCNFYFGNRQNGSPSIDLVIKETFNLSRARLLNQGHNIISKKSPRFTSEFFTIDFKRHSMNIKNRYSVRPGFQENLCRLIKRGLYKIYLEENDRINNNSSDDKFNFIREFARYNLGDCPVYYFDRTYAIIASGEGLLLKPHLMFNEKTMNYLLRDHGFYEIEFFGHVLSFAITPNWLIQIDKYLQETIKLKANHFKSYRMIKKWNDIDLSLSIFDRQ